MISCNDIYLLYTKLALHIDYTQRKYLRLHMLVR
jgi:hypothetical protein